MAISNTTIQIKKSVVSGNTPSSLANGEIAINSADGKLFYRTPSGSISSIQNQQSFATVNANSSLILATSGTDTLSIVPGNNISIAANTTSKTITINSTASGGGAFNYWQNTAPTSANSHDFWTHTDTGVMYENFGTPSSPVWAEVGPTSIAANSTPGAISGTSANVSQLNVSYFPATTVGTAVSILAANTIGGTGYADMVRLTNSSGGATNPNKTFRLNSSGGVEVVNSAYTQTIAILSDSGNLTTTGTITAGAYTPGQVIK